MHYFGILYPTGFPRYPENSGRPDGERTDDRMYQRKINRDLTRMRIPKINSVHFGGKWIAAGVVIGIVIPLILWLIIGRIYRLLVIIGGIILLAFLAVLAAEMYQDFGKTPYYLKVLKEQIPFDPEKQEVVVQCSVCTGEKVAGFRDRQNGHFTEVMVFRSPEDEQRFMEIYHLNTIRREY